jgi:hypothetical protein
LINPNYASPTSAQMIQHRLGDFEAQAEALSPVARVRRRSCSHQPDTPDAGSSADQPLQFSTSSRNELARSHKLRTVYFSLLSISASV